jgi:hypothetical protein
MATRSKGQGASNCIKDTCPRLRAVSATTGLREQEFEVAVGDGVLRGHRGGDGRPALLLHGGAAVPDYTGGCADELGGLFHTIRYTQRPDRPARRLRRCLRRPPRDAAAPADTGAGQADRGDRVPPAPREVTEAELVERWKLFWPLFFVDRTQVGLPAPSRVGVACSIGTNASIAEHFERGTLEHALPETRLPVLFVHGEEDPLPVRSSTETAALIPGARVITIPACGHFPWVERPGEVRRAVERWLAG